MNKYLILYRQNSLDNPIEFEIVQEETNTKAMLKWIDENQNTKKHYSGYVIEPLTKEQEELFKTDYLAFKKEYKTLNKTK